MQTPDDSLDDSVDAMLAVGLSRPTDDLRGVLLAQTVGVIRRRRRLKRCVWGVSLLGCYLAGIITVAVGRPGGQDGAGVSRLQTSEASKTSEVSGTGSNASPPAPARPPRPEPSIPDANRVAAAQITGYQRWRRTGDYYLHKSGDISRAVRDYARALDHASDQERAISPGQDNWLLMALKDAREKEREHGQAKQN